MEDVFWPEENAFPDMLRLKYPFYLQEVNALRHRLERAVEYCCFHARQYVLDHRRIGKPLVGKLLVLKKLEDVQTEITLALQNWARPGRMKGDGTASVEVIFIMERNSCGSAWTSRTSCTT